MMEDTELAALPFPAGCPAFWVNARGERCVSWTDMVGQAELLTDRKLDGHTHRDVMMFACALAEKWFRDRAEAYAENHRRVYEATDTPMPMDSDGEVECLWNLEMYKTYRASADAWAEAVVSWSKRGWARGAEAVAKASNREVADAVKPGCAWRKWGKLT
jgi:hypothetical protein